MRGPIARATLRTTGVLFLRLLIQAGALLLLARLLGPADYGALAGATALATMLGMLSTFGTQWMLLAEVAREPARSREMLATALGTTTAIGGVLFAIYASAAHLLFGTLGLVPTLVAIGIAETVVQPLLVVVSAQQQALGHIATSQIVTTAPLSLRLAVIAGLWAAAPERPLAAYAVGYLCAGLAALAAAAWSGRRDWPRLGEWRCARPGELRAATGYAVLGLTSAAPAELDKTLAARLLAPVQAGIYAATARIVMAAVLPIAALMFAATPRLFREQERAGRLVRAILLVSAGYGLALAAFLVLAAPVLAPFFGAKFAGLETALRLMAAAIPAMALRVSAGYVLMSFGRAWWRVSMETTGLCVLAICAALLCGRYGLPGMITALTCAEWSMALLGLALLRRRQAALAKPADPA